MTYDPEEIMDDHGRLRPRPGRGVTLDQQLALLGMTKEAYGKRHWAVRRLILESSFDAYLPDVRADEIWPNSAIKWLRPEEQEPIKKQPR